MSTGITLSPQFKSLMNTVEAGQSELAKYLPPHLPLERFIAQVKMAFLKNAKLVKCTPASVFDSVRQAADLGLDPSGTLGSAYLVPYGETCQLIPGYRGLTDLACRSGFVKTINAWVIYEKDEWEPPYAGKLPKHRPYFPMPDDDPDAGRVLGAWARAVMANGATECHVMPFAKLEAIRLKSPTVKYNMTDTPWFTHTSEMYRKCPIRALAKSLPLSPIHSSPEALAWRERFAKAVEIEDAELVEDTGGPAHGPSTAPGKGAAGAKARLQAVGAAAVAPAPMSDAEKEEAIRREHELAKQQGEPGSAG